MAETQRSPFARVRGLRRADVSGFTDPASHFTLQLWGMHVARQAGVSRTQETRLSGEIDSESTLVLVVDDDASTRRALKSELVAEGYEVDEASDGEEALESLAKSADGNSPMPDVVLLDISMPNYSGLGVLKAMRAFPKRPAVVVITGHLDPSIESFAGLLGAARVLHKPINLEDLFAAIVDVLSERAP